MYHLFLENYNEKAEETTYTLSTRTLRFLVVLRIQPHMNKGDGLSRSERALRQRGGDIWIF